MNQMINLDLARSTVDPAELSGKQSKLAAAQERLQSTDELLTGWTRLPETDSDQELQRIVQTAEEIRRKCDILVVVGIGGSYLGAKAAIEALGRSFQRAKGGDLPKVIFAGYNLSGVWHHELLEEIKDQELCVCVISKSGSTAEPGIAFSVMKNLLYQKYGRAEGRHRIYAITDKEKGLLREESMRNGYTTFVIPDDVGGRYSVLTAVGLLPMAVAGIDIIDMLRGAKDGAAVWLKEKQSAPGQLAMIRRALFGQGKAIEIFESYEPRLGYFAEWLKQLFGESEGKNGTGIFPASLQFSTDLHSMGQFLQDGNQIFFETVLTVLKEEKDIVAPADAGALYGGKSMNAVNRAAMDGVIAAHEQVGIPIIKIEIPQLTAYYFGQLIYFFEMTCALGCYLLEVNPYDQPGVEQYKAEMKRCLEMKNKG